MSSKPVSRARVKARVLQQLEPAIADALSAITAHNALAFFRHCGYENHNGRYPKPEKLLVLAKLTSQPPTQMTPAA